jgi:hypothetical protein
MQDAQDAHTYAYSACEDGLVSLSRGVLMLFRGAVAAFAVLCYDIVIAFDQEVRALVLYSPRCLTLRLRQIAHVWQRGLSISKALYVTMRYLTLVILLYVVSFAHPTLFAHPTGTDVPFSFFWFSEQHKSTLLCALSDNTPQQARSPFPVQCALFIGPSQSEVLTYVADVRTILQAFARRLMT